MKKLVMKVLAWTLFLASMFGFGYYAGYMWCYEIEHCFGM